MKKSRLNNYIIYKRHTQKRNKKVHYHQQPITPPLSNASHQHDRVSKPPEILFGHSQCPKHSRHHWYRNPPHSQMGGALSMLPALGHSSGSDPHLLEV